MSRPHSHHQPVDLDAGHEVPYISSKRSGSSSGTPRTLPLHHENAAARIASVNGRSHKQNRRRKNADSENSHSPPPRRGCCRVCLAIFLVVIALVVAGGLLLWKFLPEQVRNGVTDAINVTDGSGGFDLPDFGRPSGESAPAVPYQFQQCSLQQIANAQCCNGLPNACAWGVDQLKYAGLHNAMATTEDGFFLGPNHEFPLEQALEVGYRVVNIDVGNCDGKLELVHGLCRLGKKDPRTTFVNLNNFLNRHPRELVILPIQFDTSAGGLEPDMGDLYNIMGGIPDLVRKIYVHEDAFAPWPTLGELLDGGHQLIVFHYGGPRCFLNEYLCPPGFHDYFYFAGETQFDFNSVTQLQSNASYACEITRGENSLKRFFGLNAFVTLPSTAAAHIINQDTFIRPHVELCEQYNQHLNWKRVNWILVDFWTRGNLPAYVQQENAALGMPSAEQDDENEQENGNR